MRPKKQRDADAQGCAMAEGAATSGRREIEGFRPLEDHEIEWRDYYGPEWAASPERRERIVERLFRLRAARRGNA